MNEIIKGIVFFRRILALTSITSLSLNDKGKDKRKDLINSIRKTEISNKLLDREYEPIKKNKI